MDTIKELLSSWDKLVVIGTTPEKHDSILTACGNTKVAIEYSHQVSETDGRTYTHAYIVGYTTSGHRFNIQSWGCHGEDETTFHKWFLKKYHQARKQDYIEKDILKDTILRQLKD